MLVGQILCLKYTKIGLILYIFHLPNCSVKLGLMWIEVWFYRYIVNNDRFRDEGCMLLMKTLLKSVTFSSSILFWFEALISVSLNDGHYFYHLIYHSQPAKFTNLYALKIFIVYIFSKEERERETMHIDFTSICIRIIIIFFLCASCWGTCCIWNMNFSFQGLLASIFILGRNCQAATCEIINHVWLIISAKPALHARALLCILYHFNY